MSEWIKCSEEKPDSNVVLCCRDGAYWLGWYWAEGQMWLRDEGHYANPEYWHALPEPPKEEQP